MKRSGVVLACVVLLGLVAGPAFSGERVTKSRGAVKLALHQRTATDGATVQGSGPKVGWAVVNTTAKGKLVVQVHMDVALKNTEHQVYMKINNLWDPSDVGAFTTNARGKGNGHFVLEISDYTAQVGGTIDVQVVVKSSDLTYETEFSTATQAVALK